MTIMKLLTIIKEHVTWLHDHNIICESQDTELDIELNYIYIIILFIPIYIFIQKIYHNIIIKLLLYFSIISKSSNELLCSK